MDLQWCDENNVQLAVFPECYLQGHAYDAPRIARRAVPLNGDAINAVLKTLAPFRTTTVIGVIEQRDSDLYNTAIVVSRGEIIGMYSKVHINEEGFAAGDDHPIFTVEGCLFGINICNDANYPETARRIAHQGARVICFPLNNMLSPATASKWRNKSVANLQQRAIDTGCWVVSSDVVGEHDQRISYGCTCIVSPDGQIIRRVAEGVEGAITADMPAYR